jgi:hypothetical protein
VNALTFVDEPQHMVALSRANHVRLTRARLHREIAALPRQEGYDRVAELLLDPPEELESLAVGTLICWVDRVGPTVMRRFLRHRWINELRPIGKLTYRQALELAGALRNGSWGLPPC